jgi:hypothetical protein
MRNFWKISVRRKRRLLCLSTLQFSTSRELPPGECEGQPVLRWGLRSPCSAPVVPIPNMVAFWRRELPGAAGNCRPTQFRSSHSPVSPGWICRMLNFAHRPRRDQQSPYNNCSAVSEDCRTIDRTEMSAGFLKTPRWTPVCGTSQPPGGIPVVKIRRRKRHEFLPDQTCTRDMPLRPASRKIATCVLPVGAESRTTQVICLQ